MEVLKENLLYYFEKRYFDFEKSEISFAEFHPQVLVMMAINGLFYNNRDSKLRFVWPFVCISLSIVGTTLELITVSHAFVERDIALFTQSFAYTVIIGVICLLYFCIFKNTKRIYILLDRLDDDFRIICQLGNPYKSTFLRGQTTIWKWGLSWMSFVTFVAAMFILFSVIALSYHHMFVTQDETSIRPLPFPLYLPEDDPHRSPNYEIFMVLMYMIIVEFASTFPTYVYIVLHMLLHCSLLLDMILIGLDQLYDGLEQYADISFEELQTMEDVRAALKSRIKRIVDWHNSAYDLAADILDVYGMVLAYQVVFSSVVMCLMAFYVSAQMENGTFDFCVTLLVVGACVQLWIPCYVGSLLRNKCFAVGDKCFHCGWHETSLTQFIKKDLQLIIMRSQSPIVMQITCLPILQLETFSSIMSTAYSYFNMLQQRSN